MPSGPKKRRAEKKKNDTLTKTSTNSATDTYEEKVELQAVDQKTNEAPMMVDDENIQITDISSKKTKPTASDDVGETGLGDLPVMVNAVVIEDTVEDAFDDSALKPHDAGNSSEGQLSSVGGEMKLLEQLLSISAEIGLQAEKQVSLAKHFSLNLSQLLEELKFGKIK